MGDFSSDEECEVSKVTEKDKHVTLVSYVFFLFFMFFFRSREDTRNRHFFFQKRRTGIYRSERGVAIFWIFQTNDTADGTRTVPGVIRWTNRIG